MVDVDPSLAYTIPFQLTKRLHRQPYDSILPKNNRQSGRILLITGGGSGIGAAAAKVWAAAGTAGIVITGRRSERLEQVAAELRELPGEPNVLTIQADITVEDDVTGLFDKIKTKFGKGPDVLLHSAGTMCPSLPIGKSPLMEWWNDYEINVKSLFLVTRSFIKSQLDPKNPTGTIIFVSSGLSGLVTPGWSAYVTSKLAAERFIEHVDAAAAQGALEYANIRAFTIIPGIVDTEMLDPGFKMFAKDDVQLTGMLALWLMRPEADFLRGQLVSVNWDVDEMVAHKKEIEDGKLLQIKWHPILPCGGGRGLSSR